MRRWTIPLVLVVLFLAEWLMLQFLYNTIGLPLTMLLMVLCIPLGFYLLFREGAQVRTQLTQAFTTGKRLPETTMEGAMVAIGGALMILPGVVSSMIGAALTLAPTRRLLSPLFVKALNVQSAGIPGISGGFSAENITGATGLGRDGSPVVDANPNGAKRSTNPTQGGPRVRTTYRTWNAGTGTAQSSSAPGSHKPPTGNTGRGPRKAISAEVVNIERNPKPPRSTGTQP